MNEIPPEQNKNNKLWRNNKQNIFRIMIFLLCKVWKLKI